MIIHKPNRLVCFLSLASLFTVYQLLQSGLWDARELNFANPPALDDFVTKILSTSAISKPKIVAESLASSEETKHLTSSNITNEKPSVNKTKANGKLGSGCKKASNFTEASGLAVIVTGMEKSGTTVISRLIMSDPNLMGGFECGMLLGKTPAEFANVHPLFEWMVNPTNFWNLTPIQRDHMVHTSRCHAEMYKKLRNRSPLFSGKLVGSKQQQQQQQQQQQRRPYIVDKTPRYAYTLSIVMTRAPQVPVVVVERDVEELVKAWGKRGSTRNTTMRHRKRYERSLRAAQVKYPNRIFVLNMTRVYQEPGVAMREVFGFLKLTWKDSYLSMDDYNQKIPSVYQVPPFLSQYQMSTEIAPKLLTTNQIGKDNK
ncbi:hypothetical protein ACA910_004077 [Epithemia clementina (nom. ined.)]